MSVKRPGQNSNGQAKQPSANPNGQAAPPPPGVAPSSAPHAALKSTLAGTAAALGGMQQQGQPADGQPQAGDLGMLQTRVQFKDMPPIDQAQVAQQMGVDPFKMLEIGQQQVNTAAQQGQAGDPTQGPVPNTLSGPGIDPSAQLDNFPHDLAALQQLMVKGYSPGADPLEHQQAQNAHAIGRAMEVHAQQNAQNQLAGGQQLPQQPQGMPPQGGMQPPGPPGAPGQQPPNPMLAIMALLQHRRGLASGPVNTAPPQLNSAMMGGAAPGGPVVNG